MIVWHQDHRILCFAFRGCQVSTCFLDLYLWHGLTWTRRCCQGQVLWPRFEGNLRQVSVLPDGEDYVGCIFDSDKIAVLLTMAVGSSLIIPLWCLYVACFSILLNNSWEKTIPLLQHRISDQKRLDISPSFANAPEVTLVSSLSAHFANQTCENFSEY